MNELSSQYYLLSILGALSFKRSTDSLLLLIVLVDSFILSPMITYKVPINTIGIMQKKIRISPGT